MIKLARCCLNVILLIAVLSVVLPPSKTDANKSQQNVLILNSYNTGFTWADDQTGGAIENFRKLGVDPIFHVEYMDWKYSPTQENLRLLYEQFRLRYATRKIDLIVTTDDAALEFALKHRAELFSDAPIVFTGVMIDSARQLTRNQENVTGVCERFDAEGTIKLMYKLNPELQRIYLIYDNTESGKMAAIPMEQAARKVSQHFELVHFNTFAFSDIIKMLSTLPRDDNSAVLINTYSKDVNGVTMEMERYVKLFSENSSVPVYILYDFDSGFGALGGSLIGGKQLGQAAAALAVRIINGEKAASVPWVEGTTASTILDYKQLEAFKIPITAVPDGVTLINRPLSFYNQYKEVVWLLAGLFMVMIVFILSLIINIRQRLAAEEELKKGNLELSALYEEMLASQEELQHQYEELKRMQEALYLSEERYKLSSDGANDGLWDWNLPTDEMYLSGRCAEMLGLTAGTNPNWKAFLEEAVPAEDLEMSKQNMRDHLKGMTPFFSCEYRINTPSGLKWIHTRGKALADASGQRIRMAGSLTDITERKYNEKIINNLAYHDALTGLANRTALNERLNALTARCYASQCSGALLFLDLDNFKVVNDTFGHTFGDRLLVRIGEMFENISNERHFIARMGGDEFVILLGEIQDVEEVLAYARQVVSLFAEPLSLGEKLCHITVSVGVTVFPTDGVTAEELFKNADLAMYRAKAEGKNRYVFFNKEMDDIARQRMLLGRSLRDALAKEEFKLFYQPQICVTTGKIYGFEALIRWYSKEHGLVMPMDFIRIAEETGLIVPIGQWVLRTACEFLASLHREGYKDYTVSVNLSVIQLMQSDFVEMVKQTIADSGVSPESVGLEITESVLMESFDTNVDKLGELRLTGVSIHLDDFGTGYSSLKYLKSLPIDVVKIDKSFIDALEQEGCEKGLTGLIIELAKGVGLKTIAEGVETEAQLAKIRSYNCDMVQGYLFSAPMPEEKIYDLLKEIN